jgi:transposase
MRRRQRRVLKAELVRAMRRGKSEHRIACRARIVLERLFEGRDVSDVARRSRVSRETVRLWVQRYFANPTVDGLRDRSRSGRPKRITTRDEGIVISLACQRPDDCDRLEAVMTQETIVEEAAKVGTVVSRSSVQRILAATETKPHRERYYLFTRKDDPDYAARRDAICELYMRSLPRDEIVVCFDEKTGMQVLGDPKKINPSRLPTRPAQVALQEHNYKRLGSRSLSVVVRPDTGEVVTWGLYPPRGYATAQAVGILRATLGALTRYRVVHVVWDNASTHVSNEMRAFLTSRAARCLRVYYTPKHASWLNLAENFFSRFARRYLRRRRFVSLPAFEAFIPAAIDDYNKRCTGMSWTYNPSRTRTSA